MSFYKLCLVLAFFPFSAWADSSCYAIEELCIPDIAENVADLNVGKLRCEEAIYNVQLTIINIEEPHLYEFAGPIISAQSRFDSGESTIIQRIFLDELVVSVSYTENVVVSD